MESGLFTFPSPTDVDEKDFSIGTSVASNGKAPYQDANIFNFKGYIDEVRIYDYGLSDNQVSQLYLQDMNETILPTPDPILSKTLFNALLGFSGSSIGVAIITILKFLIPRVTVYVLSKCSGRTDTPESQVTNAVLAKFWIGCCGLGIMTGNEYERYVDAIVLIIAPEAREEAKEHKPSSLLEKWRNNELNDRQKNKIKYSISEELKQRLLGEHTSSCYRFFKSFCYTEITPQLIERYAPEIAGLVRSLN